MQCARKPEKIHAHPHVYHIHQTQRAYERQRTGKKNEERMKLEMATECANGRRLEELNKRNVEFKCTPKHKRK